ncbi:peptide chain release factor N(5)-glutamine methyltransferase [Cardiobacteriaceae bacterium TAE3-ERU3]|nr:peptide chain release factor N(5)-glutamine methyltransferase [Cardiobacteriaceae bacterium TAE3-ERU3]
MYLSEWIAARQHDLGGESPEYDARLLAESVTGLSPTRQRIHNPKLTSETISTLNQLAARRCGGEPIAYILGHQPFYTLDLLVNQHTLIPRGDSECLVEAALARLPVEKPAIVADLGTGSGALALAIASERPQAQVIATDRSRNALTIATANRDRCAINNLTLLCADWLQSFAPDSLDLIISNPPYIAPDDPHLDALAYEPTTALIADDDGFADLYHLIAHAATYLKPGGWLLLEHGYQQALSLRQYAATFPHWHNISTLQDYGNNDRVTLMQR